MRVVDAHAHIFDVVAGIGACGELRAIGNGRVRWANGDEMDMIPQGMGEDRFTADTLAKLLKENGVEKAVLLQGGLYGFQNDATQAAAQAYPDLFVASGTFDPFCLKSAELADRLIHKQKISILKFELSSGVGLMSIHPKFDVDGDELADTISMLEQVNGTLVLDIGCYGSPSYQPEAVARISMRHPGLRIVVCHLMAPGPKDGEHLRQSLECLKRPNVWFDLSAIPWNIFPEQYPYPTGQGFIRMAKEIVGSEKLLWGSDSPCVLTRDTYPRLMDYFAGAGIFTSSELDQVMFQNAVTAYHLSVG
ncbi:amidohydrolase [Oscillibacter sp.]|uniref:amidohydrolase family protein n=1 Tax=Oscillibacter sp. TaxID=1945593 RepID=UPI002606E63A|nr:amidohydrolase family protein [Oscillibacter sp.]MDD3347397.1 amidohydrolase family protein [Oscillibacter sp.]